MSKNTLCLVIPVYNEAADITDCLQLALHQTEPFNEIIVVNNNSTDNTVQIVQHMAKQHATIRLLHQPVQGTIAARNMGFNAATSDIVGRIDADTRLSPGWAAAVRQAFANKHVQAINGGTFFHDAPFKRLSAFGSEVCTKLTQSVSGRSPLVGCNMALRRSAWLEIRHKTLTTLGIFEDVDLAESLQAAGYSIRVESAARAGVAARRFRTSPVQFSKYMAMWPRTYALRGDKRAAMTTYAAIPFLVLVQMMLFPVLAMYDAKQQRFVLRPPRWDERKLPTV